MRKAPIIVVLAALACAGAANAHAGVQHVHWRHHDAGQRLQRMLDTAGATDAQRTQITAIAANYKPRLRELHQQLRANRRGVADLDAASASYASQVATLADQRGQIVVNQVKLRAQLRHEIAGVLTDDQRAALRQAREARRRRAQS